MKIRVKHNNTEIEITDSGADNTNSLIYYNVNNITAILNNIATNIIKLEMEGVTSIDTRIVVDGDKVIRVAPRLGEWGDYR
jgi:hypothetical protein